jgi:hypothetical protein
VPAAAVRWVRTHRVLPFCPSVSGSPSCVRFAIALDNFAESRKFVWLCQCIIPPEPPPVALRFHAAKGPAESWRRPR